MRRSTDSRLLRKQSHSTLEAMEDVREMEGVPNAVSNSIKYMEPNRDRALGVSDRTGRHFDEVADESSEGPGD